jgi:plastocyanin
MQRKTLIAIATALVIGLAAGYLLWGRQRPETTKVSEGEVAAASKGESPPDPAPRIPARDLPAGTASRPTRATASAGVHTSGRSGTKPPAFDASTAAPLDDATADAGTAPAAVATQGGAVVAWAVGEAIIEGEVQFSGVAPAAGRLHREADPYCARHQIADPTVLVANGKLTNVWVHVIKGAPDTPAPASVVEIDQQDCMYTPRVTTAVVGQKIVARNDDPILHNVHTFLGASTLFNKGMPNENAAPIEYMTVEPGVIRWKCDVHPWMRGYVGISRNPFQAVTGADGVFRIANLPPGRYTLAAWHEKFGAKTLEVVAPAHVVFAYDGTEH